MLQNGEQGVILQRDKETYAVAPHIPCGVVSPDVLRTIADVAEKYNATALKVTSASRIAIVGLREKDVAQAWADLGMEKGAATGLCVRSVKACPGTTFCRRGLQDSLGIGLKLDKQYHGIDMPSKCKIGVSGCPNQCAETCIKDIGLVGMPKGWIVMVGGNGGSRPRLSQELIRDVPTDRVCDLVDRIIAQYRKHARRGQRLGAMIDGMGLEAFKGLVCSEE
jgi:NAD(P)H-nitrite reductase large subunit